jgi:hypothetical protein
MPTITHYPPAIWRERPGQLTRMAAHPYHRCLRTIDSAGTGAYVVAFTPHCPLCREERRPKEEACSE